MATQKHYTAQQKFQIVKEGLTTGTSITELCKKHNIHPNNFYKWQKQFFESAMEGFTAKKGKPSAGLEAKISELEKSNQRMKDVIAEITAENIELKKKL